MAAKEPATQTVSHFVRALTFMDSEDPEVRAIIEECESKGKEYLNSDLLTEVLHDTLPGLVSNPGINSFRAFVLCRTRDWVKIFNPEKQSHLLQVYLDFLEHSAQEYDEKKIEEFKKLAQRWNYQSQHLHHQPIPQHNNSKSIISNEKQILNERETKKKSSIIKIGFIEKSS